ncbi:HAMP domain-containing histidine kinase [Candidatus Dojkabacteria bacterium]|nr:HAMP domain-containing histidine kinase [Candidatus Dojkabacteria bacterium]
MDTNIVASQLLPFKNPENTNFIWHELKRFPTLSRLFVSNLNSNIYGELSDKLTAPINDLGIFSIYNITWIDNILAIEKIAGNNLNLNLEEVNLLELCKSVIEYLEPFRIKKKIQIITPIECKDILKVCSRYTKQIINNILISFIDCTNDNSQIYLGITKSEGNFEISMSCKTENLIEPNIPQDIFDPETVYSAKENLWSKHSMDFQVAKLLAEFQNGEIEIINTEDSICFKYKLNLS